MMKNQIHLLLLLIDAQQRNKIMIMEFMFLQLYTMNLMFVKI